MMHAVAQNPIDFGCRKRLPIGSAHADVHSPPGQNQLQVLLAFPLALGRVP
jgi:hypothetical protein